MIVAFNLILDDILFPDGRIEKNVLGGGGVQTAFGMRLWTEDVGLVASVGKDFPPSQRKFLIDSGINIEGLRTVDAPTLRAEQILDTDGTRSHAWRVPLEALQAHFPHRWEYLPERYRMARGYHLGIHPLEADLDFIAKLRQTGACISVETFREAERRLNEKELRGLLSLTDIFSPTRREADSLLGKQSWENHIRQFIEYGARIVVLRMDLDGAAVAQEGNSSIMHVPAMPVEVKNPIGAGNAFCGGFLAGWLEYHDLYTAAVCGTVSASFLLEQVGMPVLDEALRVEAERRFNRLRKTGK